MPFYSIGNRRMVLLASWASASSRVWNVLSPRTRLVDVSVKRSFIWHSTWHVDFLFMDNVYKLFTDLLTNHLPSLLTLQSDRFHERCYCHYRNFMSMLETLLIRGGWVKSLTSHSTLYRSFRGRFLQDGWPNQQRQSTEGSQLVVEVKLQSHQDHSAMLQRINTDSRF